MTFGQAFRFVIFPQISPDFHWSRRLFVRLLAVILATHGLLDRSHPACQKAFLAEGGHGVLSVLREARQSFSLKLTSPDDLSRAIIYYTIQFMLWGGLAGFFVSMLLGTIGTAHAGALLSDIIKSDMAGGWIKTIFGITSGNFSSAEVTNGIGEMMFAYNSFMCAIAGMLVIYNAVVIVLSTAHSGETFGQSRRFVWWPMRIVIAMACVVPAYNGWSPGQLAVITVAEYCSTGATNVWQKFTGFIQAGKGTITAPTIPTLYSAVEQTLASETCMATINSAYLNTNVPSPAIRVSSPQNILGDDGKVVAVEIRYGGTGESPFKANACGSARFAVPEDGSPTNELITMHQRALAAQVPKIRAMATRIAQKCGVPQQDVASPTVAEGKAIIDDYNSAIQSAVAAAVQAQNQSLFDQFKSDTQGAGWVAAPAAFVTMSRLNSAFQNAASSIPSVAGPSPQADWPAREVIFPINCASDYWNNVIQESGLPASARMHDLSPSPSGLLDRIFAFFGFDSLVKRFMFDSTDPLSQMISFGNALIDFAVALIVGSAVLSAAGGLAGLGAGAVAGGATGPGAILTAIGGWLAGSTLGQIITFLSAYLTTISFLLASCGFALALFLPFLPLVRFMYGLASWLVTLAEGVVAVPILAIAHIELDGEGIAGPGAKSGYMILLQIGLRPILMVFGLVFGFLIFQVVLGFWNVLFIPYLQSAEAGNSIGFVMTVGAILFYTLTAYGLANTCFKAIDEFPRNILRWLGGALIGDLGDPGGIGRDLKGGIDQGAQNAQKTALESDKRKVAGDAKGSITKEPNNLANSDRL